MNFIKTNCSLFPSPRMYIHLRHKFSFDGCFAIRNYYHITKQPNPNICITCALILSCIKSGCQYMNEVENLSIKFSSLSSLPYSQKRKAIQVALYI